VSELERSDHAFHIRSSKTTAAQAVKNTYDAIGVRHPRVLQPGVAALAVPAHTIMI
jgi:hypothetical protein